MAELTYESAFPGRFLKAALFEGKHVTLTIEKAFQEDLEGEKGVEKKLILSFTGKALQLVCNKTNALCLKEMFGNKVSGWVGKRVTFFPTMAQFGPKKVDAIRVFGSPDIPQDMEVRARIGRKNFAATMKAVGAKAAPVAPSVDPRILTAWGILGTSQEKGLQELAEAESVEAYLSTLNNDIDRMSVS